ncbi:hypothetical protein V3C99_005692 [Haemonchus contortus]
MQWEQLLMLFAEDVACNVWLQLPMPALSRMWHAIVVITADGASPAEDVACNVWLQLLMRLAEDAACNCDYNC